MRYPFEDGPRKIGNDRENRNSLGFDPRRDIQKVDDTPVISPDDIRTMASDALKMQDALIAIQEILKRPAAPGHSLALHHAIMIRDIHKAVNLPAHSYLEYFIARHD